MPAFETIVIAALFSTLNTKFVDLLKQPIKQKWPQANLWYFTYVGILTGLALNWFAEVNLFENVMSSVIAGKFFTGLVIGAGSWLIYEVWIDKPDTVSVETSTESGSGTTSHVSVTQEQTPEVDDTFKWSAR